MKERELRLLLTQKCNFKCAFCHKEGVLDCKKELLNVQDYTFVYKLLRKWYGWNTISITGGEPLCHPDLTAILNELYDAGAKITLITNGSLLDKHLEICKYLEKLTVSVHTTNKAMYKEIIGVQFDFENLIKNLKLVKKEYPNTNIRFNSTIIKDINSGEREVFQIVELAKEVEASIKFIELLPNSIKDEEKFVSIATLEAMLKEKNFTLVEDSLLQKIYINGESIIILARIVCSVSKQLETASPHCTTTNNIFLAADGTIKPCMKNPFEISVFDEIKNRDINGFNKKIRIFFNTVSILCPYEKEIILGGF